jgi:CBS domain-containing protein
VYDVTTLANGMSPFAAIGAASVGASFTPALPIASTSFSGTPTRLGLFGNNLIVSDAAWRRALIFDVATVSNGEAAIGLLGQFADQNLINPVPDFFASNLNNARVSRYGFSSPRGMDIDKINNRLFVADAGNIVGAISEGDLRRAVRQYRDRSFELKAFQFMSSNPKLIESDKMVVDAIGEMERFKITALFVVESKSSTKLKGLIRLQDLMDAKIV